MLIRTRRNGGCSACAITRSRPDIAGGSGCLIRIRDGSGLPLPYLNRAFAMDDLAIKKNRLLLDLMALDAEFSRVFMLNSEPPLIPENSAVSQGLVAAHELVRGLIAKLQK